ncbi:MAG: hypothetical protein RLZZ303_2715 [Candidatus Hydrogenedentota bacterium]|jgi:hypothetical protein
MKNQWLEELAGRLRRVNAEIESWPGKYPADALTRAPGPGAWSAVECMDHVGITAKRYHRKAAEALHAATAGKAAAPFVPRYSLMGRLELLVLNPKGGIKMKAPSSLTPVFSGSIEGISRCVDIHNEFLCLMAESDGLDLNCIRFWNPIVPVLRMNLGETFLIMTLHAERHLAQARRAIEASQG